MKPVVTSFLALSALMVPIVVGIDTSMHNGAGKIGAVLESVAAWRPSPFATISDTPRNAWVAPVADQSHATTPWVAGAWPAQTKPYDVALAAPAARSAAKGENPPIEKLADIIIDVIIAYTKQAADQYPDIKVELLDHAIEETNVSFRRSNLGHVRLRLVHAYQTDYVEEGTHFDHVWRFADKGDSYMDEIHGLRDAHRADVAVLIVDDSKGCGLATRVEADADEAFAVVHHQCAAANYTLAHEIGHLIGARHELSYVNGTDWRDIMALRESCGGCVRVPVWSNPALLIKSEPAGTPALNNARVIAEQAARVAAFR